MKRTAIKNNARQILMKGTNSQSCINLITPIGQTRRNTVLWKVVVVTVFGGRRREVCGRGRDGDEELFKGG